MCRSQTRDYLGENKILGKGNSKYKSPEVGINLVGSEKKGQCDWRVAGVQRTVESRA